MDSSGWVSVRCVFRDTGTGKQLYEERITLWRADDVDVGISRAEQEAKNYAEVNSVEYLGLAQAYLIAELPADGSEIFSLVRGSDLGPDDYLDTFFDTGEERQRT